MGLNPETKKSEPDRLYLSGLDVKVTDVYLCGEYTQKEPQILATGGNMKITLPQETAQTLVTNENVKIALPHKSVSETGQTLVISGSAKITHNPDREQILDANRYNIDTRKLDFSTIDLSSAEIEQQNYDLIKHVGDFLTDEGSGLPVFLEPEAVQLPSFWCRIPQQMWRFIGIIFNVKYKVEKDHRNIGVYVPLDDEELKPLMTKTSRRYFNALRSNEKHTGDAENYLYGTI